MILTTADPAPYLAPHPRGVVVKRHRVLCPSVVEQLFCRKKHRVANWATVGQMNISISRRPSFASRPSKMGGDEYEITQKVDIPFEFSVRIANTQNSKVPLRWVDLFQSPHFFPLSIDVKAF
jgi:hypothetical protein